MPFLTCLGLSWPANRKAQMMTTQPNKTTRQIPHRARMPWMTAALSGLVLCMGSFAANADDVTLTGDGLMHTRSAYSVEETVKRIHADVDTKGIKFFTVIDQGALGVAAKIDVLPSQLVLFGNPPLGLLFLTSNPDSGMDWPVRVLVRQDKDGHVYAVYQNWDWVAKRYGITNRTAEFAMATTVVASILSSVADCNPLADCTH